MLALLAAPSISELVGENMTPFHLRALPGCSDLLVLRTSPFGRTGLRIITLPQGTSFVPY